MFDLTFGKKTYLWFFGLLLALLSLLSHIKKIVHSYLFIISITYFLINVVLLPIGYDPANLEQFLYSGSYIFLGLNPYRYAFGMTMGYPSGVLYTIPTFIYYISNFDLLYALMSFKLIGILGYYMAFLTIRHFVNLNLKLRKSALAVFLLNPLFFFFNDIQMVDSVLPLSMLLIGYVLVTQGSKLESHKELLLGVSLMLLSIYTYYFTILILPTLFYYTETKKQKLYLLLGLLIEGLILAIPIMYLDVYSTFFSTVLVSGTSSTIASPFSIFRVFPYLVFLNFINIKILLDFSILIFSFLIPILLRKKGIPAEISIGLIFLISFELLISGFTPDLLLFPFCFFIIMFINSDEKISPIKFLLLFLAMITPMLFLQEMYWGLDGYTGIFYWLQNLLNIHIALYTLIPSLNLVTNTLILSYLFILLILIGYTLKQALRLSAINKESIVYSLRKPLSNKNGTIKKKTKIMALFMTIILLSLILSFAVTNSYGKTSDDGFPRDLFQVNAPGIGFVFPSESTYLVSKSSLIFPNESKPTYFFRNVTNESFFITGNVNFSEENYGKTSNITIMSFDSSELVLSQYVSPTLLNTSSTLARVQKELDNLSLRIGNYSLELNHSFPSVHFNLNQSDGLFKLSINNKIVYYSSAINYLAIGKMNVTNISINYDFYKVSFYRN